jgi:phosphoribosyl 1,2-cyclic phosphodiesterase
MSFEIKIWGCRGSIPVSSPDHLKFGGATACIEININGNYVIIDAGSGVRDLGIQLLELGVQRAHLLISHGHYDHIMGLPFFYPVYKDEMCLDLWSGHTNGSPCTRDIIAGFMQEPYLPVTLDFMHANMNFHDVKQGETLDLGNGISAVSCPTTHPGGCLAWRVNSGKHSFVFWSDHEHGNDEADARLVEFAKDADLMVYDAMYTDEEYPNKIGFGHSTWRKGCEFAKAANVRQLLLFHHSPERTDEQIEAIEAQAHQLFSGASAARDGQIIRLG